MVLHLFSFIMKRIFLFLFFLNLWASNIWAQTYTEPLYIIYDSQTLPMTRDMRKYSMLRGETQPMVRTVRVGKIDTYWYNFALPIYGRAALTLRKKEGTDVNTIPIDSVAILYPQAKTILQVEAEVMPLIEQDFCCPTNQFIANYRTYAYFSSERPIYVIELDTVNNRAIVVSVTAAR
jgi:hypothetical protein